MNGSVGDRRGVDDNDVDGEREQLVVDVGGLVTVAETVGDRLTVPAETESVFRDNVCVIPREPLDVGDGVGGIEDVLDCVGVPRVIVVEAVREGVGCVAEADEVGCVTVGVEELVIVGKLDVALEDGV